MLPELLSEAYVANYIGKTVKWLRANGPKALRFGRSRKYTPESVAQFIQEQAAKWTSTKSTEVATGNAETGSTVRRLGSPAEQKIAQRLRSSLFKSVQGDSSTVKNSPDLSEAS